MTETAVPLGLIAWPLAVRALPRGVSHPDLKLDVGGIWLVGLALVAIIYPLIQGEGSGWPPWTYALLAAGAALLLVFVRYERRRGHNALIEPSLLTNRMYLSGVAVMLALFSAFGGLLLCISLYGQLGRGWSPIRAGLSLTPMVIGLITGMVVSGLVRKLGRHLLHIGIATVAAGTTTLALMLTDTDNASIWLLVPGLFLVGVGVGTVLGQIIQLILAAVSMNEVGSASGVMEASQQLSTALGVAVLGTIFFALFKHHPPADALRVTSWVCLAPLTAAFLLVFLLPRHALADGGH
jgi:predicted MFS family arabinose efflux permease